MECEMCGKEGALFKAEVEGSVLSLCEGCSKYGKIVSRLKTEEEKKFEEKKKKIVVEEKEAPLEIVVPDYSEIIKKKRELLNLKQEELAKKINEKESVIHHVETGGERLNIPLARKLERFFNVKLVEIESYDAPSGKAEKTEGMTIGDIIQIKKKSQ